MRSSFAVPVLAVLVLGTASCTSATDGAASAPTTSITTTATAAPEASSTASSSSTTSPAAQVRVVSADGLHYFRTPSGNIACEMAQDHARCEIAKPDFEPPAKPSDCEFDYGSAIAVDGNARAEFLCISDTVFGAPGTFELAYGEGVSNGSVTCASAESGLTCATADGSHGFELSRAAYRLY